MAFSVTSPSLSLLTILSETIICSLLYHPFQNLTSNMTLVMASHWLCDPWPARITYPERLLAPKQKEATKWTANRKARFWGILQAPQSVLSFFATHSHMQICDTPLPQTFNWKTRLLHFSQLAELSNVCVTTNSAFLHLLSSHRSIRTVWRVTALSAAAPWAFRGYSLHSYFWDTHPHCARAFLLEPTLEDKKKCHAGLVSPK